MFVHKTNFFYTRTLLWLQNDKKPHIIYSVRKYQTHVRNINRNMKNKINIYKNKHSFGDNPAIQGILSLIRDEAPVTRARLSKLSGYSRSTISVNCDKLLETGLISEENFMHNGSLSKRTKLSININAGVVIGIELGATGCELGVCDLTGQLIQAQTLKTELEHGPEPILLLLEKCIDAILADYPKGKEALLGIGMGLPSPVDYQRGMAFHPAFMPGWHLYPVADILNQKYHCPVFVDNEVNIMALGEYILGKNHSHENLLFIKAGTGIGAGIILNGRIYRGEKGLSGNIGHIQVPGYGDICTCGKKGCLEAIVGGPALSKKARILVETKESPLLEQTAKNLSRIRASEIRKAANLGDEASLTLIREAGTVLGTVLGQMVILFDPGCVVIGGGLTAFGPNYLTSIRDAVMTQCSPWFGPDFSIRESQFGDKSGIIGSAMLAITNLFEQGYLLKNL